MNTELAISNGSSSVNPKSKKPRPAKKVEPAPPPRRLPADDHDPSPAVRAALTIPLQPPPPLDRNGAIMLTRLAVGSLTKANPQSIRLTSTFAELGITPSALAEKLKLLGDLRGNPGLQQISEMDPDPKKKADLVDVIKALLPPETAP